MFVAAQYLALIRCPSPRCAQAMEVAARWRRRWLADVVVDVCGYRRNGHNEQDDPSLTLPLVQRCIDNQPGVQEVYTAQLLQEGVVAQAHLDRWERKLTAEYEAGAARPWCLLAPSLFSYGVCPLVFAI